MNASLDPIRDDQRRKALARAAEAAAAAVDRSPHLQVAGEIITGLDEAGACGFLAMFEGAPVRLLVAPCTPEETAAFRAAEEAADEAERRSPAGMGRMVRDQRRVAMARSSARQIAGTITGALAGSALTPGPVEVWGPTQAADLTVTEPDGSTWTVRVLKGLNDKDSSDA